jgi:ABC-type amino acid transport substrate-binding protein
MKSQPGSRLPRWVVGLVIAGIAVVVAGVALSQRPQMQSPPASQASSAVTVFATDAGPAPAQAIAAGATPVTTATQVVQGSEIQAPDQLPTESAPSATKAAIQIPPFEAKPAPNAEPGQPNPLFGPNYVPDDGLPTFICSTDAFASYLTLIQMQVGGFDIKHGFHLGLVPYGLNEQEYSIPQDVAEDYIKQGKWDCTLNTVDGVARTSHAVITGIVDESAGGDGIWARDMANIYDLKGKRIAYSEDSSADFFMRYALQVAQLDAAKDVTLVPFGTIDEAVAAFNDGKADAVSAWEPQLSQAKQSGGKPLVTSDSLRIIIDAILVSRESIANKPDVVQAFHDAWFDTAKAQNEDFDTAAQQIAAWGNNDWTTVTRENAASDFRDQLKLIAQASLADNVAVMTNLAPVINQLNVSRRVWSGVQQVPTDDVQTLIDPRFVLRAAGKAELQSDARPINATFSLGAPGQPQAQTQATAAPAAAAAQPQPQPTPEPVVSTDEQATLAVLPCRKFTFLPNSAQLTQESRRVLDLCVVPTLQQRAGLYLMVRGSAAWPGPKGKYTEDTIRNFAKSRAQAIADYLASQDIDPGRLVIEGVLPPEAHRETDDPIKQSEDRYVEMSLIAGGL